MASFKKLHEISLLTLLGAVGLLLAPSAWALTLLPPLPVDCKVAKEVTDPGMKVRLYTRCLDGGGIDFDTGMKMQTWQRHEVHFLRGNALFELERYREALADYDLFIAKAGGHVWAYHQRGLTHLALANDQSALADFNAALGLNADAIVVRYNRGPLYAKMGNYPLAREDLRRVVALSPETALYANDLAWLLATCPDQTTRDGKQAVAYARQAVKMERSAVYLDTLAAALARSGDFVQAASIQKEAIGLLQKEKVNPETISEFTSRLELYSSSQPYTEPGRK